MQSAEINETYEQKIYLILNRQILFFYFNEEIRYIIILKLYNKILFVYIKNYEIFLILFYYNILMIKIFLGNTKFHSLNRLKKQIYFLLQESTIIS